MNKTAAPSAYRLVTARPIGLTSERQAEIEGKPMADQKIRTAFEKLLRLHSSAGEAVAQFAAIGAIREIIFRPGSQIFVAYELDARAARDAVKLLEDPKANALMNQIVSLTERMIQVEAALPPARNYIRDIKNRQAGRNASSASIAPSAGELNLAGIALYLGSGTLWNYLGRMVSRPELQGKNLYVLSQPELIRWCKWNGATSDDIEVLIDKVTQYLSTFCQ
jgi:hypothetical protein